MRGRREHALRRDCILRLDFERTRVCATLWRSLAAISMHSFSDGDDVEESVRGASIYDVRREGGGWSRNAANLQTNSIDFADKEGAKIPKLCGRHIWKPPLVRPCLRIPPHRGENCRCCCLLRIHKQGPLSALALSGYFEYFVLARSLLSSYLLVFGFSSEIREPLMRLFMYLILTYLFLSVIYAHSPTSQNWRCLSSPNLRICIFTRSELCPFILLYR